MSIFEEVFGKSHMCATDGHYFEPRYDEVEAPGNEAIANALLAKLDTDVNSAEEVANALRALIMRKVYIRDICRYCGQEIKL